MDKSLMAFLISLIIVVVIAVVAAIIRQCQINKDGRNSRMRGSGNHVMETSRYSGCYSVCKQIGEADEEY